MNAAHIFTAEDRTALLDTVERFAREADAALSERAQITDSRQGMANCPRPRAASQARSGAPACSGQASGKVSRADRPAPTSTAGARSS